MFSLWKLCGLSGLLLVATAGAGHAEPSGLPAPDERTGAQPGAERGAQDDAVKLHAGLGKMHFDHGRYQEAIAEYREAYELKANPGFLLEIAGAYRQIGVVDRSLFFYDRYLETRPDAPDRREVEAIIAEMESGRRSAAEPLRDPPPPRAAGDARLLSTDAGAATAPRPARGRRPVWRRWWFWGAVGTLVVGGVAAAVMAASAAGGEPGAPGTELGAKRFESIRPSRRGARGAGGGSGDGTLTALACLCAIAAAAPGAGCRRADGSALVVVVTVTGSPPPITALEVSLSGSGGAATNQFQLPGGRAITFPTTLGAELPGGVGGALTIEVTASDAAGEPIATGRQGPLAIRQGTTQTVYVALDCAGAPCQPNSGAPDGGAADAGDGGAPAPWPWSCGNGTIDPGETCDVAIAPGAPGACPPRDCDDGVACTDDVASGSGCTRTCAHAEISASVAADGCCPAGGTHDSDPDCSATCGNRTIEKGETCDVKIAAGQAGACPAAADCDDGDPCTTDRLISAGTCAARCTHVPITVQSGAATDGCCPAGAASQDDADCPEVCGDGDVEAGESCDTALPPSSRGACPAGCDDGDACTRDFVQGDGCSATCAHQAITAFVSGDGCCPAGGNRNMDADCAATCGNGALEPGESCDNKIAGGAGACPTACPAPAVEPAAAGCVTRALAGDAPHCSARCVTALVTACSPVADGCCPAGCAAAGDPDCASAACGNGTVDATESCDVAIRAGAGACPDRCADLGPCQRNVLVNGGTCRAACVALPVDPRAGDGCCPPGATFDTDADCAPVCGNGITEPPFESCDLLAAPGGCAAACPADTACTAYHAAGSPSGCNFRCTASTVTACAGGDGCCPAGCDATSDSDCAPICGNGVREPGERCDKGITAGQPGACARDCDDGDPCTDDHASGTVGSCTRSCSHAPITACATGDRCCPAGCAPASDGDCTSVCGDGQIGAGETCDPPSSCPTVCPDDGDPCTQDRLVGDPLRCSAACVHAPITACSGSTSDLCCPTGCDARSDGDC